jgi:prophage regulatory protein
MFENTEYSNDRFLREGEVKFRTGLSRTTRWRLERFGDFPRRRRLSPNTIGWLESEVEAWIHAISKVGVS